MSAQTKLPLFAARRCSRRARVADCACASWTRARRCAIPVMFVVLVGSAVHDVALRSHALRRHGEAPAGFIGAIAAWLWFTVLFANFAEALAEGRGKAQAEALRAACAQNVMAEEARRRASRRAGQRWTQPARRCAWATSCWSRPAISSPRDGEVDRRRRLGRRERAHRRIRAGHPRIRRRLHRRDGRHARAVRLARRTRAPSIRARPSSTA